MEEQEYTLEEKEKIIAEKVEAFEFPEGKLFFYMGGDGATRIMRDFWNSDLVSQAIKFGTEGLGMDEETALEMCTGKMMLIGDSRIESYPGGIEGVKDDGRFGDDLVPVTKMVVRLERMFISSTALATSIRRDLEYLLPLPTAMGHEARGPFRYGHSESAANKQSYLDDYEDKAKKALSGLDILYPLVGKTMADLPIDKIPATLSDIEHKFLEREWAKFEDDCEFRADKNQKKSLDEKMDEVTQQVMDMNNDALTRKFDAEALEEEDSVEEDKVHAITEDNYKHIGSCWITPEGTMFGGHAEPWIHIHLLRSLTDDGYFKDLPYNGESEDEVEEQGWIKLSGGYGFMLYAYKSKGIIITEEQKQVVIDYCIANNKKTLRWNGRTIELKEFVNWSCTEIMTRR